LAQLALAWILRRSELSSVITGATRVAQVVDNAAAAEIDLDAATLERIEVILNNRPKPLPS
jgi:aryl-alcohol dehydrogenase-like predicted oxidoreductase